MIQDEWEFNYKHRYQGTVTSWRDWWFLWTWVLWWCMLCYLCYNQSSVFSLLIEADFEVFRLAGATRCTDGVKFRTEEGPFLIAKFHPHRCNDKGIWPPNWNFLLIYSKCGIQAPYPLRNFHKICWVCTPFQDALAVKISLDLLKGLWSYGVFKLTGSRYPQIFSAP